MDQETIMHPIVWLGMKVFLSLLRNKWVLKDRCRFNILALKENSLHMLAIEFIAAQFTFCT